MRTARSSSRPRGVSTQPTDQAPPRSRPPGAASPGVGLETPSLARSPSTSPLGVACRTPWPDPPQLPPWVWAWTPQVWAWRPPSLARSPSTSPWVWAWRPSSQIPLNFPLGCGPGPPSQIPLNFPLGVGLETCKACWDTTPLETCCKACWHTTPPGQNS